MSEEKKAKTILVFNADLQKETEHSLEIDSKGEIILTCLENGRFIKFPKGTTTEELKAYISKHRVANEGQITLEAKEAAEKKFLDELLGEKKE